MTPPPSDPRTDLKACDRRRSSLVSEFWGYLKVNKKWWLLPIVIVILLLGGLVWLGGSVLAPFLYPVS